MQSRKVTTIDGETRKIETRAPRQSECLDYVTDRASAVEDTATALERTRRLYEVAIDLVARVTTIDGVDDVRAWFDESIAWSSTVDLADGLIADRLPSEATQGKSETPRDS